VLVVVVVLAAGWAVSTGRSSSAIGRVTGWSAVTDAHVPPPAHEEARQPLGAPAPLAATSASYAFEDVRGHARTPVAYDPCRPVHYVVRARGAPPQGARLVHEAISRVSAATGLVFVDDGGTDEAPSPQREPYQPDRYGRRWAPVLVAWSTPRESPDLAAAVAGAAGSTAVTTTAGQRVYVTGQVQLDARQLADDLAGPHGAAQVRAVLEHELGHLVGLAHVDDPTQLMYRESTGAVTDYATGDLTGLTALGRGPCVPHV
jgi:Matrixin